MSGIHQASPRQHDASLLDCHIFESNISALLECKSSREEICISLPVCNALLPQKPFLGMMSPFNIRQHSRTLKIVTT